ncbi:MAG: class I SAM-dependent methyltransferase [Chlamydiota bacterium]
MTSIQELWKREFLQKGIPSSYRETPSHSVVWFEEFLRQHAYPKGALLDVGCGRGRNAFFLKKNGFSVSGLDFVEENIQTIRASTPDIDARCHDLSQPFPFKNEQFDYAIDVFCFNHLVEEKAQQNYLMELKRVLKKGGLYLLSLASVEDGFYGPLLQKSPQTLEKQIIDPYTKISAILYRREEIEKKFAGFQLLEFSEKRNLDQMHGMRHVRCVLSFIFESLE